MVLDIDHLAFRRGEVVALVGENGAGKSTMMGVVAGSVPPDTGSVSIAGHMLGSGGTLDSQRLGVAMVSQEFPLVGQLSVAENLLLGRRPSKRRFLLDKGAINAAAREMLAEVDVDIPIRRRVDSLSVAQRQLLEIAKALGHKPLVLILDEPTSALAPVESGPGAGARSPACGWRGDRDLRRPPLARSESGGGPRDRPAQRPGRLGPGS